ncbi:hypothetical protein DAEQUDRAFT_665017, partial [Daedalea quercina L-15889]
INRPVHLVSGPLVNHTIRAELDELQKADLGRKCGNKDRRTLDPPPVVRIKLFEIINEGTSDETEQAILISDAGYALAYGFICLVDIFPWPPPSHASDSRSQQTRSQDTAQAVIDGVPIAEQDSCTQAFVGATFISASCLIYEGKQTLLFVFPDIACSVDGIFLIRYRALNLFSYMLETERLPILAECWGGPVTIWPTKDFPGLAESTDLTKACLFLDPRRSTHILRSISHASVSP